MKKTILQYNSDLYNESSEYEYIKAWGHQQRLSEAEYLFNQQYMS